MWLIQPDGSNERTGSPPGHGYGLFDWSPDGRWLVAESDAGLLYILEPATGLALPLPFSRLLRHTAWRLCVALASVCRCGADCPRLPRRLSCRLLSPAYDGWIL